MFWKTLSPFEPGTMATKSLVKANSIVCQAYQQNFSGKNQWNHVIRNTGYHGDNVYNGCGVVRNGGSIQFRRIEYVQTVV